jgi:hypothetical protein
MFGRKNLSGHHSHLSNKSSMPELTYCLDAELLLQ